MLRDASYSFMTRAKRGERVKQSEKKANAISSQAPFLLPPESLSHLFPLFQFPQQPSYLRASLPLGWAIAIPFSLFLLKQSLDCITRPLIDLKLLPYYLSKYKCPGPWSLSYPQLSFPFSENFMLLTHSRTS